VKFKCHRTRDREERTVYIYLSDLVFFSGLIPICHRITPQKPRPQNGARRIQPVETDQLSMASQSETSSQSHASSSIPELILHLCFHNL
jgi:hypothetical protein